MATRIRLGTNLPFPGSALATQRPLLEELRGAGLDEVWTGEYNRSDGAVPLALVAGWDELVGLTAGILNIATRGPALMAMTVAGLAEVAPGRVTVGLGTSSPVTVERWNGMTNDRPLTRMRETLELIDLVLGGGRTSGGYTTFASDSFQLAQTPEVAPRVALAALGPRMQQLAATHADAVITGFIGPGDVGRIRQNTDVKGRRRPGPLELLVGVWVLPAMDDAVGDDTARRTLTQYLNAPAYAAQQRWLGRSDQLGPMWEAWQRKDRRGALEAIPETVVDDLIVRGTPSECATRIRAFADAGTDSVNVMLVPTTAVSPEEQSAFLADVLRAVKPA